MIDRLVDRPVYTVLVTESHSQIRDQKVWCHWWREYWTRIPERDFL